MITDEQWIDLPLDKKRELRNQLAVARARVGLPAINAATAPGDLAIRHEPQTQVQRAHLLAIDEKLQWVHKTPNAKLLIVTPPQVGKSWRVSRWFPFWWLTQRPRDRILLASFAERLAAGHSLACLNYVKAYGSDYGLRIRDEQGASWGRGAASDWEVSAGGGMSARGVGGGMTGLPGDLMLIDDPVKDREAADSPVIRDKVKDWYSSVFSSRMSPEARQIVTMTRWHPNDLAGHLLKTEGRRDEGGEWEVLHLPAIAQPVDPARGFKADPLGRAPGEPLTHPRIDEDDKLAALAHWTRRQRSSTARDWGALYLGSPFESVGGQLTEERITDRTIANVDLSTQVRSGVGVDPSGGGRDTAGVVGGILDAEGRFIWTHDATAVMDPDDWARAACVMAVELTADVIVYESNYGGTMVDSLIRGAWKQLQDEGEVDERQHCPRIVGVSSRKNKLLRAEPIAQAINMKRAWFGPGLDTFKSEWQRWSPGSHWSPGSLDAGVHLAYELLPAIQSGAAVVSVAQRRRETSAASGTVAARRINR